MEKDDLFSNCRNSIVKIRAIQKVISLNRPQLIKEDRLIEGVGFLVDVERGFILTSYKIAKNSILISCFFDDLKERYLNLELISVCPTREVALCKLSEPDLELVKRWLSKDIFNDLKFGDSFKLTPTQELTILSYAGTDISYNIVRLRRFQVVRKGNKFYEDIFRRKACSFEFQGDATILSGSPVIDEKRRVVGMVVSKNRAICSRTILSIKRQLLTPGLVRTPNVSIEWMQTTRDINKIKSVDQRINGIYVKKVYPDSTLNKLIPGDIIVNINYREPYWNIPEIPFVSETSTETSLSCFFDRNGNGILNIKTIDPDTNKERDTRCLRRLLDLSELFDSIPIETNFTLGVCREGQWYMSKAIFVSGEIPRVQMLDLTFSEPEYCLVGNLVCMDLCYQHLKLYPSLGCADLHTPKVIVTQILSSKSLSIREADVIASINDVKINTVMDIKRILEGKPEELVIITEDNTIYVYKSTESQLTPKVLKSFGF